MAGVTVVVEHQVAAGGGLVTGDATLAALLTPSPP
jgi:hypothetical protein